MNKLTIDKAYYMSFKSLCKKLYFQYDCNDNLLNDGTMLISNVNEIFIIFSKNDKFYVKAVDSSNDILDSLLKMKYIGDEYPYPKNDIGNVEDLDQYLMFNNLSNIFIDKDNINYKIIDNCLVDNNNNIIQATIKSNSISNNNIISIVPNAFFKKKKKNISITNNLKIIKHNSFYCCFNLDTVILPDSIEKIDEDCFNQCISLKKINIPKSMTHIQKNTFRYCSSLKQIDIGEQIAKIDNAFDYCINIKKLLNVNKSCDIYFNKYVNKKSIYNT